jgi:outer membrane protein TolC
VGYLRAEIDRARAEQDLLRSRNAYDSARLSLAALLDRDAAFDVSEPPDPPAPGEAAALEKAALAERADLQAARLAEEVAASLRAATSMRYLPTLGAFGRYQVANVGGFTGQNDSWAVGLGLNWALFDGGLREAELREGSARIAEATAARRSAEVKALTEVRQALLDWESAKANAIKAREQRDLAAENQRLVDVSFKAGAATAVEQADATATLRNAEIAATTEALSAQLAALRVLKAAGEFAPPARGRR